MTRLWKNPRQTTIACDIRFSGIGLHSGKLAMLTLRPAIEKNAGIVFHRMNSGARVSSINADFRLVAPASPLCTVLRGLGNVAPSVSTVEHLMAALWASGVTACDVELESDSGELPILDGSAICFAAALFPNVVDFGDSTNSLLPIVRVLHKVRVEDASKGSIAEISPRDDSADSGPTIECSVRLDSFSGRLPSAEDVSHVRHLHTFGNVLSKQEFLMQVAAARTFTFENEIVALRAAGLALGGSLENAVVFHGNGSSSVVNETGLRYIDEWTRHKLLDLFGDLALCISPYGALHGNIDTCRPGHATTNSLLRKLFSDPTNYLIEDHKHQ